MSYQPSQDDIEWTHNLVRIITDGGTWAWPSALLIYSFDKPNKTARLVNVEATHPLDPMQRVAHSRFQKNLAAIGWKLVPEVNRADQP
jgi:hypothetical protein